MHTRTTVLTLLVASILAAIGVTLWSRDDAGSRVTVPLESYFWPIGDVKAFRVTRATGQFDGEKIEFDAFELSWARGHLFDRDRNGYADWDNDGDEEPDLEEPIRRTIIIANFDEGGASRFIRSWSRPNSYINFTKPLAPAPDGDRLYVDNPATVRVATVEAVGDWRKAYLKPEEGG